MSLRQSQKEGKISCHYQYAFAGVVGDTHMFLTLFRPSTKHLRQSQRETQRESKISRHHRCIFAI